MINRKAFYNCTGLTGDLIIPNNVKVIDDYAFCNCGFNGSITICSNITTYGEHIFDNITNLRKGIRLIEEMTTIPDRLFSNLYDIQGNLEIGSNIRHIGKNAFYNCTGLTGNLILPNSLVYIGNQAFYNCSGFIGSLTIPDSISVINSQSFCHCSGLTTLTLPSSITTIEDGAFMNCSKLQVCNYKGNYDIHSGKDIFDGCGFKYINVPSSYSNKTLLDYKVKFKLMDDDDKFTIYINNSILNPERNSVCIPIENLSSYKYDENSTKVIIKLFDNMTKDQYLHLNNIQKKIDLVYQTDLDIYPIVIISPEEISDQRINSITFNHVYVKLTKSISHSINISGIFLINGTIIDDNFNLNICTVPNIEFSSYSIFEKLHRACSNESINVTLNEDIKNYVLDFDKVFIESIDGTNHSISTTFNELNIKSKVGFELCIKDFNSKVNIGFELLSKGETLSINNSTFPEGFAFKFIVNEFEPKLKVPSNKIPVKLEGHGIVTINSTNNNNKSLFFQAPINILGSSFSIIILNNKERVVFPEIRTNGEVTSLSSYSDNNQNSLLLEDGTEYVKIESNDVIVSNNTVFTVDNVYIKNSIMFEDDSRINLMNGFEFSDKTNIHILSNFDEDPLQEFLSIQSPYDTLVVNSIHLVKTKRIGVPIKTISGQEENFNMSTCTKIQEISKLTDGYKSECVKSSSNEVSLMISSSEGKSYKTLILSISIPVGIILICGTIILFMHLKKKYEGLDEDSSTEKNPNDVVVIF